MRKRPTRCAIPGCPRWRSSRDYCSNHWRAFRDALLRAFGVRRDWAGEKARRRAAA